MKLRKTSTKFKDIRSRVENLLSLILLLIAMYLIITPFTPQLWLLWAKSTDKTDGFVYASNHPLAPENPNSTNNDISKADNKVFKPIPSENRLVIPNIQVDIEIVEGSEASVLMKGGWRRPKTSTPEEGGNTVIAAHRFLYRSTNASYFYNLDKVNIGDPIVIYWKGKEYNYIVTESKEVQASEVQIEENTQDTILTLYTCTPLWTAKNRLVVIAKPV